jgi:hypothetical protein
MRSGRVRAPLAEACALALLALLETGIIAFVVERFVA